MQLLQEVGGGSINRRRRFERTPAGRLLAELRSAMEPPHPPSAVTLFPEFSV